jgi:uncharacterized RDD family membrane protein YckC
MTSMPQTPFATAHPFTHDATRSRAGFWRRVAAHVIDAIAINIYTLPLGLFNSPVIWTLGLVVVYAVYYTSLEGGMYGQTVGKMALGIRVVDAADGGRIGYQRAFVRALGRIGSGIVVVLGYLWMLWDPEKQTWHDKLAASVVVPAR